MVHRNPIHRPALRIVVLADSIPMPRQDKQGWLLFEETWPSQLQVQLANAGHDGEVLNRGARNRHSSHLGGEEFMENVAYTKPNFILLGVGVNDCAPRLFTAREKVLLNKSWFPRRLRDRMIAYRSKHRVRILSKDPTRKVHAPPDVFRSNVQRFSARLKEDLPTCRLVLLPIVCDPVLTDAKSPGFSTSIDRYNSILEELAAEEKHTFINMQAVLPEERREGGDLFFPDGFHLNATGCGFFATEVARVLQRLITTADES